MLELIGKANIILIKLKIIISDDPEDRLLIYSFFLKSKLAELMQ